MSGLRDWVRDCIVNCKTSGKLNPANAAEVLTEKLAEHLDEDGGGMPSGGAPYQQLVTDGEGVAKWEDRLAYETTGHVAVVEEYTGIIKQFMGGGGFDVPNTLNIAGFVVGQKYIVTWDGTEYESEGKDVEGLPAVEVNPEEDAKVIFGVIPSDPEYVMVAVVNIEVGTEHTLRVVAVDNVLKPISHEFLPEGIVITRDSDGNCTANCDYATFIKRARTGNAVPLVIDNINNWWSYYTNIQFGSNYVTLYGYNAVDTVTYYADGSIVYGAEG